MDQINNQLAMVQAQAKLAMQIGQDHRRKQRYSDSTKKMIILLFTRLADLFGSKAASRGLRIFDDQEKDIYSEQFDLWAWKLDDLSAADFKRGMEGLEKRAEDCYRLGEEMWPPSYAEFRALAFPETSRDTQAHKPFERLSLPDKTSMEKARKAGACELDRLMAMFQEPEPKPLTPAEIADNERLEKVKKSKYS